MFALREKGKKEIERERKGKGRETVIHSERQMDLPKRQMDLPLTWADPSDLKRKRRI